MKRILLHKAHRLLAPRLVALLGSRRDDGRAHLIPITNLTSLCTRPQTIVVSVYNEWETCANLREAAGFTLSVPRAVDASLVWRLGAKYSGYDRVATEPPDVEFRNELDESFSPTGPFCALPPVGSNAERSRSSVRSVTMSSSSRRSPLP